MSTKKRRTPAGSPAAPAASSGKAKNSTAATDKVRKAAIAEIQKRLDGEANTGKSRTGKAKIAKPRHPAKPKRLGALNAAAQVLAASRKPMRVKEMIAAMEAKGLWTSPGGKTPEATLAAAIIREIATKSSKARFRKIDRGLYEAGKDLKA